jgi:hypothetical protein
LFFSSALQQCGVCDDGAATHTVVHSDTDVVRTSHIFVREVDVDDGWNDDATSDTAKSFKIVDIRDMTVAFRPVKDASNASQKSEETSSSVKRSHSQIDQVSKRFVRC